MPLTAIGCAVVYALVLWWVSTGAILWLDRRPKRTHGWSLSLLAVVAAVGLIAFLSSLRQATPVGAVIGFTSALALWGWHELSFLTGHVTGPRSAPCPAGAVGWRRFTLAASTLIYHEIALALTAAALLGLSVGQPNRIGALTFLSLLAFRLSAKLNLFCGVPNFSEEFFPDHLRYLTSYIRKSPATLLMPLCVALGAGVVWAEARTAFSPYATPFVVTGFSLLFALGALALLEHGFMMTPLPDAALWRWAMREPVKATPRPLPERRSSIRGFEGVSSARRTPRSEHLRQNHSCSDHRPKREEVSMSKPLDFGAVIVAAIMILGPMALGASGMG
jgi:putative photosynthetic complex assembly protein 2